jgi:hydrogenase 3 maturation protease
MELAGKIEELLREKTCIVGVGNYLKRDDAAGLFVVDGLRERGASGPVILMNVEDVPENYVYRIADLDCEHVIIIDAVESGGEIGSVLFGRLLELEEEAGNYSTHKLSLALTARILEGCRKKVWLLGIEVGDTGFGAGLSDRVDESVRLIRDLVGTYIIGYRKELVYEH